ncbi:MAG: DUF1826 domain-containing protein [Pseudomonadota bacterium]
MRQISSNELGDFAAIHEADVELVNIARDNSQPCESLSRRLVENRQIPPGLRWQQSAEDHAAAADALPPGLDAQTRSVLVNEICAANAVVSELMGCKRVSVRLETLSAPMCPRFHVDHVHCRMLITLTGTGTEWIQNEDVDWNAFSDLSSDSPPLQSGAEIMQFETNSWSLLKGGAWGEKFDGVVHRSPHRGGDRLLLAIDPVLK